MTDMTILRGEKIKSGDTLPNLRVKLLENGSPFNLDGYDVSMKMQRTDGETLIVDDAATVEDAGRGIVTYSWSAGETDGSGVYLVEFIADDGGGVISFPNAGYERVYIQDHLTQ